MRVVLLIQILAVLLFSQFASATTQFTSPSGNVEVCVQQQLPGAQYSKDDIETENLYCNIDFYNNRYAMCAKTWSTSPGTIIYDITQTNYSVEQAEDQCRQLNAAKIAGAQKVAKFKNTMNSSGTSGTFSTASIVYYHLSRFFNTLATYPVAVFRTIDTEEHYRRVSARALATGKMGSHMKAGWKKMIAAEKKPTSYNPVEELFTEDLQQIYGVLIRGKGERYGVEVNGVRSRWGIKQSLEFTETAPFKALRSSKPLVEAIELGLSVARRSSRMRRALGDQVSAAQMLLWMNEISELVLFDHMLSQQDRVGNIDFRWYWMYVKKGQLKFKREKNLKDKNGDELHRNKVKFDVVLPPENIAEFQPILIQKTQVNDNDAGLRKKDHSIKSPYVNFTKMAKMLDKMVHFSPNTYSKLVQLKNDFKTSGPIFQWLMGQYQINPAYVDSLVHFTNDAFETLYEKCINDTLLFDLDIEEFLATQTVQPKSMNCDTGVYR